MADALIVITDCNHINIDAEKAVFEALAFLEIISMQDRG